MNASCSGDCVAGHFCPAGSLSSTAAVCGNATVYCPPASGAPLAVPAGWYSTPEGVASAATRTGSAACAPGEYCVGAFRRPCPAGNYSDSFGQESCAVCPAGNPLLVGANVAGPLQYPPPLPRPRPHPCSSRGCSAVWPIHVHLCPFPVVALLGGRRARLRMPRRHRCAVRGCARLRKRDPLLPGRVASAVNHPTRLLRNPHSQRPVLQRRGL
jgi:hypothetical protein